MSKVTTVGDRVKLKYKTKDLVGVVKFVGSLLGKNGTFYGIELEKANTGDNNGDFKSIKYFTSARKKGIFIKKSSIIKTNAKNNTAPRVTVGSAVKVPKSDSNGTIKFIGEIDGKKGIYYGIELEQAKGKNNGSVKGRAYFECDQDCGVFVKENGFETAKVSYNIKPKNKKQKSAVSKTSPASPRLSSSSIVNEYDKNRRRDIEKVVNVINGNGSESDITNVITSYDDKKENEDVQWLKIIATLKVIYDSRNQTETEISALKQEISQLKNANYSAPVAEDKSEELKQEINDLRAEVTSVKSDKVQSESELKQKISNLKQQNVTLKNNILLKADTEVPNDKDSAEFQRRIKFEKEEIKQKYESQIKTILADKARLEKQLLSRPSPSPVPPSYNHSNEQKVDSDMMDADTMRDSLKQLTKDKEQLQSVVRSRDEIITNAKQKIAELQKELATIKEEEQKEEVQLSRLSRLKAKNLLEQRVSDQQSGSLTPVTAKKTISELLNESGKDDAMNVIASMNVMKFEYDKKLKKDTYNLDLTNNAVLRRLTNVQRKQFMFLLAHCICDSSGQQKVEKVKMSNMSIDDKLFPEFCQILIDNIEHFAADEWWLESNKIGNEGMAKLSEFLGMNPQSLEVIKMYNNKTVVKTQNINDLLTNIEKNDSLQKFTFEWRLTQHRDRIEKQLKKNQDLKRKRKWAGKSK